MQPNLPQCSGLVLVSIVSAVQIYGVFRDEETKKGKQEAVDVGGDANVNIAAS